MIMATNSLESNPFWLFSLTLWDKEQAQSLFLKLQSEKNIDVVLLLFALWCTQESYDLKSHKDKIAVVKAKWNVQLVAPIRAIRDQLNKTGADAQLRRKLLEAEVLAEQLQHDALYALTLDWEPGQTGIELLSQNILAATNTKLDQDMLNDLRRMLL
jgi:uncharacterized protein (TIGR02444 family)